MKNLIDSVESSIKTENWYAALILSLTLPDIAGKIENPNATSNVRYANWFDTYVGGRYKAEIGAEHTEHIFLSGNDCYALRCSFLHEGKSDITNQRARDILEDFEFLVPPKGSSIHCNQSNERLQLQVDTFCNDILDGLRTWLGHISNDPAKQTALSTLLQIHQIK